MLLIVEDISEIHFLIYKQKTYVVTPQQKHSGKTVLIRGHNIYFYGIVGKSTLILSLLRLPFLTGVLNYCLFSSHMLLPLTETTFMRWLNPFLSHLL